jgi:hypothetical protein
VREPQFRVTLSVIRISQQHEHYVGGATFKSPPSSCTFLPARVFPRTIAIATTAPGARIFWITSEYRPPDDSGGRVFTANENTSSNAALAVSGPGTPSLKYQDITPKPWTVALTSSTPKTIARGEVLIDIDHGPGDVHGIRVLAYDPGLQDAGGLSVKVNGTKVRDTDLSTVWGSPGMVPKTLGEDPQGSQLAKAVLLWTYIFRNCADMGALRWLLTLMAAPDRPQQLKTPPSLPWPLTELLEGDLSDKKAGVGEKEVKQVHQLRDKMVGITRCE